MTPVLGETGEGLDPMALMRVGIHAFGFVGDTDLAARNALYPGWAQMFTDIAKERGIAIAETFRDDAENFESVIRLRIVTERQDRTVSGALFGQTPRIVEIKDVEMEASFAPHMLYVTNADKPGFIGALGQTLGAANVNIATFNLGRSAPGADAIALLAVDEPISEAVIEKVRALPNVKQAKPLKF